MPGFGWGFAYTARGNQIWHMQCSRLEHDFRDHWYTAEESGMGHESVQDLGAELLGVTVQGRVVTSMHTSTEKCRWNKYRQKRQQEGSEDKTGALEWGLESRGAGGKTWWMVVQGT